MTMNNVENGDGYERQNAGRPPAVRSAGGRRFLAAMLLLGLLGACVPGRATPPPRPEHGLAVATFAGGCFWCMEAAFDEVAGVVSTTDGYTGGHAPNPTYEEVSAGGTGHAESVQVEYDPQRVSYRKLLDVFWHNVDPTSANGQFCDIGSQYRSEIFYHDAEQRREAEESKAALERSKPFPGPIVTQIAAAASFYPAEQYHQDYYLKNPLRYSFYRAACGHDARLQALWGQKH